MDVTPLADAVRAGSRRDLARAITLVESQRPDHRADDEDGHRLDQGLGLPAVPLLPLTDGGPRPAIGE